MRCPRPHRGDAIRSGSVHPVQRPASRHRPVPLPIAAASLLAGCGDGGDSARGEPSVEATVEFAPPATPRDDSSPGRFGRSPSKGLIDFSTFDPATPQDGFAENINVGISPIPAGVDREAILAANLDHLRQVGITVVGTDELCCGDWTFDRVRPRPSHGGSLQAITCTANPDPAGTFLGGSDAIMRECRPR